MKMFMLMLLLPCVLAAEFQNIQCPDGRLCPVGKTCCESPNGVYQCCDLEEEDKLNKKLVSTITTSIPPNTTTPEYCGGTQCSDDFCCEYVAAKCCSSNSCCPVDFQCCSTTDSTKGWCCRWNQKCSSTYLYCMVSGAASITPGITVMVLISIMTIAVAFAMSARF